MGTTKCPLHHQNLYRIIWKPSQKNISKSKPNKTNNLTHNGVKALKELQQRDDITITNADKGDAITILDTDGYIKEAKKQLNNEQCYQKLSSNPTLNHINTVNHTFDLFKTQHKIPEKVA